MYRANRKNRPGSGSIMAIFLVAMMSMLAIAFASMSNSNAITAANHESVVQAQAAAESGLEYACYLAGAYVPPQNAYTPRNTVNQADAENTLGHFAIYVQNLLGTSSCSWNPAARTMRIPANGSMVYDTAGSASFHIDLTFQQGDSETPHQLHVAVTGYNGDITRSLALNFNFQKDGRVLEYAIASRGRMIVTGDTTIDGDIYSAWYRTNYWNHPPPFETTSSTTINGTLNTVLTEDELSDDHVSLETLDEYGNPTYQSYDAVQGDYEGINYGQSNDIPGLSINDYNTDDYKTAIMTDQDGDGLTIIPQSDDRTIEYFPHQPGYYNQPKYSSSYRLSRHTYQGQTFENQRLPGGRDALFQNCTFNGILYIDHYNYNNETTNNVRFENCVFNGPIVTSCPQQFNWMGNCLYFTGEAQFYNNFMEESTILAPHYNVNLGNTGLVEEQSGSSLKGAIIGGIVDVRGNAEIDGTIISMYDTSPHSSGYVTNIGFADDGGNESSSLDPADDIGVIHITPDPSRLLPSGMVTPVIIKKDLSSYVEY